MLPCCWASSPQAESGRVFLLHGALAFLPWGGWRNKSTYTPQHCWWVGFSSGMLHLFLQRDLFLSMMCLVASDGGEILELDLKAEFFFSFFFLFFALSKSKIRCMGMKRRSKWFGSNKNCILIIWRILCWCFHFYLLLLWLSCQYEK